MAKQKLYIETSVWNFYYADDAPEKKEITVEFFEELETSDSYEVFISRVVIDEIMNADLERQELLFKLIDKFKPEIYEINLDVRNLAEQYLEAGVLTENSYEDALHAAIATINKIDILLSWNLKHLANLNRMGKINEINRKLGYSNLLLTPPRGKHGR